MREIELKFIIDEDAPRQLRSRVRALNLSTGAPKTRTLRSIYFDTPEHALRKAGISLRLRREGRRWIQTIKTTAQLHGGLSQVSEVEDPAPGARLRLEAISDASIRNEIMRAVKGSSLQPICETVMRRTSSELFLDGHIRAELAIDVGEIHAGGRSAKLREAEIELLEGNQSGLFDVARALFPVGGLTFSRFSKAARGYLLAEEGRIDLAPAPRNSEAVVLDRCQIAEQAARDVLRECFDQIATNMVVVRNLNEPEGPHQLRVGLRRLRSAFSVFLPVLGSPEMSRLREEARWLSKEVGKLRDLDVVVNDVVWKEAQLHPEEPSLSALGDRLMQQATELRHGLCRLLEEARAQLFVLDLAQFVESRGWLVPEDFSQTERLAAPVAELAEDSLRALWKKVSKHARRLDTLDVKQRHEFRKELKKLRYVVEFFSPILVKKSVDPFRKRLQKLQDMLGALNDAVVVGATLTGVEAEAVSDRGVHRAMGWVIGASQARAEFGWAQAKVLWQDLEKTRPFWK